MLIDLHCPVEPRGYEITIDKKKELTRCMLTFFNLTDKDVNSVEVRLKCFDSFGEPVGDSTTNEVSYHLQDLNARGKSFFGDNKPIPLPDHPTTRTVSVSIGRVKFADGGVWTKGDYVLVDVSTKKLTGKALDDLRTVVGEDAICYARQAADYWQCACGRANPLGNGTCIRCDRVLNTLLNCATGNELVEAKLKDIKALEAEKIKQEELVLKKQAEVDELKRKAMFNKNLKKFLPIAVLIIAALAFFIYQESTKPPGYLESLKANMKSVDVAFDQIAEHLETIENMDSYELWGEQLIALTDELDRFIGEANTLEPTDEHKDMHELYLSAVDHLSRANNFMRVAVNYSDSPWVFPTYINLSTEEIREGWRIYHIVQDMLTTGD